MKNYIRPGEVYRELEQRKRQEAAGGCLARITDVLTGIAIGVLIGIGIGMIR